MFASSLKIECAYGRILAIIILVVKLTGSLNGDLMSIECDVVESEDFLYILLLYTANGVSCSPSFFENDVVYTIDIDAEVVLQFFLRSIGGVVQIREMIEESNVP